MRIAELVEQLNEAFNSSSFTIYKTRFFYQCSFGKRIECMGQKYLCEKEIEWNIIHSTVEFLVPYSVIHQFFRNLSNCLQAQIDNNAKSISYLFSIYIDWNLLCFPSILFHNIFSRCKARRCTPLH